MRQFAVLAVLAACGDGAAAPDVIIGVDSPVQCPALGATGAFQRGTNPAIVAGEHVFTDLEVDTSITDPDLAWNDGAGLFDLYYATRHAATYGDAGTQVIRHGQNADVSGFTLDDAPSLVASTTAGAWDSVNTEAPSVVVNPTADADHRYLMVYAGANAAFAYADGVQAYSIGAAFSEDGSTFTRVAAADSPHGEDGLVLTGQDVYPTAIGAIVTDPELAFVEGTYHLWFTSYACGGPGCPPTQYGIAHATSGDGIHWTIDEAPVVSLLFDAGNPVTGGSQPSVIYDTAHCEYEMWISDTPADTETQPVALDNANGPWHATSTDGITWTADYTSMMRDLTWSAAAPGEERGMRTGADIAAHGSDRFMVYTGYSDQNVPADFTLPDTTPAGTEAAVMTLDTATR